MKRLTSRGWFGVGVAGAFLFCLSLCALVRSCEMRAMGYIGTSLAERIDFYWSTRR